MQRCTLLINLSSSTAALPSISTSLPSPSPSSPPVNPPLSPARKAGIGITLVLSIAAILTGLIVVFFRRRSAIAKKKPANSPSIVPFKSTELDAQRESIDRHRNRYAIEMLADRGVEMGAGRRAVAHELG